MYARVLKLSRPKYLYAYKYSYAYLPQPLLQLNRCTGIGKLLNKSVLPGRLMAYAAPWLIIGLNAQGHIFKPIILNLPKTYMLHVHEFLFCDLEFVYSLTSDCFKST